ncbi:MAG: polysaccharide pyruvyl transferase family protein [Segetibacter sp.]
METKSGGLNFGDHLSKVIVTKILAGEGHVLEEQTKTQRRLLGVGSILHFAQNDDVIWGSGINGKIHLNNLKFKRLDVRSVRGPLTRLILLQKGIDTPEIYGDPALLIPNIFPGRFKREPKKNM